MRSNEFSITVMRGFIQSALKVEDVITTRQTAARCIKRFLETKYICWRYILWSWKTSKVTDQVLEIVQQQMRVDDGTTAIQLLNFLTSHGVSINLSTIIRCRTRLEWTFRGS